MSLNIAFVASEVFPYSKTGGLADIAYFLPKGLSKHGHKVTVFTPYYQSIGKYHHEMTELGRKSITMGGIETIVNYYKLTKDQVDYVFIQNMHYFERDRYYGYNDDAERFTCFSYAVLEALELIQPMPEILHINDWQTGMIPFLLNKHYKYRGKGYESIKTLLTIHNLEYQGNFDTYVSRFFNCEFDYTYIHFDRVNFLKAGIECANKVSTVSPSYKDEIMTQTYGFTLDGTLQKRSHDLVGILNGLDYDTFNPEKDEFITPYSFDNVEQGKIRNKHDLYAKFELGSEYHLPLVVYIGRLASQKGLWMIKETIEGIVSNTKAKFFFLGSGSEEYQNFFRYLTEKYPHKVGNFIGYNEPLAHLVYAASDIFLMPSEFEPCGLGQMIAMKYGSLPIVRETGGLKDTVIPYNKFTHSGTGFSFANLSAFEFKEKVYEAIELYQTDSKEWLRLVHQAMMMDFSMEDMATNYNQLYQSMMGE